MDWNNGTIFRVYVVGSSGTIVNSTFNVPVDIDQQLLTGKVFIGVENMVLKPSLDTLEKTQYWDAISYIQLSSINLPPYIDYSGYAGAIATSGNTRIFSRIPMVVLPTTTAGAVRFGFNQIINKNSIIYEMLNNQNALSNGRLTIQILDTTGTNIPNGYITSIAFTLVIYKAIDNYNVLK